MTQDEFIDKWLVGYESREQKEEFAIEMMADLASLQSKGKTKSAEEFLRNKSYPSGVSDAGWEDFKHREKGVLFVPFVIKVMEEYAQSPANKDGWVSVEVMSKLADEFMDKARGLMNDADRNGNANSIQSISFNKEAAGWKYASYLLRDAIGISRTTKNEPQP